MRVAIERSREDCYCGPDFCGAIDDGKLDGCGAGVAATILAIWPITNPKWSVAL
jgi:hypothetical protein